MSKKGKIPEVPPVEEPKSEEFDEEKFKVEMDNLITEATSGGEIAEPNYEEDEGDDDVSYTPEPEVAAKPAPAPASIDLNEIIVPDDADVSGFFKGKPVTEVFKSHHHAENRMRELAEENTTLKTQVIAAAETRKILAEMNPPQATEQPHETDPFEGLNLRVDPLKDPEGFYRELHTRMETLADQKAEQKLAEYKQRADAESHQTNQFNRSMNSLAAAHRKIAEARPELMGTDGKPSPKFDKVAKSLINEVVTSAADYPGGLEAEASYIAAYSNLYGPVDYGAKPTPDATPPPAPRPVVTKPEGTPSASRARTTSSKPTTSAPSLRQEQADAANQIASMILQGGLPELDDEGRDTILAEVRQRTAEVVNSG